MVMHGPWKLIAVQWRAISTWYAETGTGNKWVVRNCVESFTLHLNQDRGRDLLSPIILVLVPVHVSISRSTQCEYAVILSPTYNEHSAITNYFSCKEIHVIDVNVKN